MARRPIRWLTLEESHLATPNLRRLTLTGDLSDVSPAQAGGYLKLLLPPPEATPISPGADPGDIDPGPLTKRSYTIRGVDPGAGRVTLEFVHHDDGGPATRWAAAARPGDQVLVAGPGPVKMIDPSADGFVIAGDMTGLPAVAVNVERLPPTARGHVVVEVLDEADRQDLPLPAGVTATWLLNPHPTADHSPLADAVRGMPWPDGRVSVWLAGEFNAIRTLRRWLKDTKEVPNGDLYISSYWKIDATDEQHKLAKKSDAGG